MELREIIQRSKSRPEVYAPALAVEALNLRAEVESLRATISRLREYAGHKDECNWWRMQEIEPLPIGETRCDCGYDAAMAELEETK